MKHVHGDQKRWDGNFWQYVCSNCVVGLRLERRWWLEEQRRRAAIMLAEDALIQVLYRVGR